MNAVPDWKLVTGMSPTTVEVASGIELYTIYGGKSMVTAANRDMRHSDWTHWRFVERAAPPVLAKGSHEDGDDAAHRAWTESGDYSNSAFQRNAFIAGRESMRQAVRDLLNAPRLLASGSRGHQDMLLTIADWFSIKSCTHTASALRALAALIQ